jgi:hypothetical protein
VIHSAEHASSSETLWRPFLSVLLEPACQRTQKRFGGALQAAVNDVSAETSEERPSWGARRADALVLISESFPQHGAEALNGGGRQQIVLRVGFSYGGMISGSHSQRLAKLQLNLPRTLFVLQTPERSTSSTSVGYRRSRRTPRPPMHRPSRCWRASVHPRSVFQLELRPIGKTAGMTWRTRPRSPSLRQLEGSVVESRAAARFDDLRLSSLA